ncbi:hypothetical protein MVEN_02149100 [Mycena venus]|uniref:Uncharacterized protein n=1 Tax=Mycena venus TaxID=2733690 RepID=A0A8H6XAT7_9AGAR|nr:hypothetical protein MVEN_02149100 [Mycena venus]
MVAELYATQASKYYSDLWSNKFKKHTRYRIPRRSGTVQRFPWPLPSFAAPDRIHLWLLRARPQNLSSDFDFHHKDLRVLRGRGLFVYDFSAVLGYTIWIRGSTGRLCVDLAASSGTKLWFYENSQIPNPLGSSFLDITTKEAMLVDHLAVHQYGGICYQHLSQSRYLSISTLEEINLAGIFCCSSVHNLEEFVEIAAIPDVQFLPDERWFSGRAQPEVGRDGWNRYNSDDISGTTIRLHLWDGEHWAWLGQAGHIFSRLGITSNFEDYVVVNTVYFEFIISAATGAPKGFLFLCPAKDFQNGPSTFKWPEYPTYWSLDSSGIEPLSLEEAINLGFPSIILSLKVKARSWDAGVYNGLRQFHQAKGFDPDSQEIAQHLGHPLYRLSTEINAPFAHIDYAEDHQTLVTPDQSGKSSLENCRMVDERRHISRDEGIPLWQPFTFVMKVQLALIFFALLYGEVWSPMLLYGIVVVAFWVTL